MFRERQGDAIQGQGRAGPFAAGADLPRTAPENASSIAGLLLTTEAVVTEKPEPKGGAPAMPGGGGMY